MKNTYFRHTPLLIIGIIGGLFLLILYFKISNSTDLEKSSPKDRDKTRLTDSVTIQIALTNYWIKNQKYPESLSVLQEKNHLSTLPKDPTTQEIYAYQPENGQKSYTLCVKYETIPNAPCEKPKIGNQTPIIQKQVPPSSSSSSQLNKSSITR